MIRKVVLIVDHEFGEKLIPFAEVFPVWIIDSIKNSEAIKKCRDSGFNVTTFKSYDEETNESICERIVGSLDDHFDENAQISAYDTLEVVGASLGIVSLKPFIQIGFVAFFVTPLGFVARKFIV